MKPYRVQDAAAEGRGLTGTGLRLLDHIETLGEGHDTPLLDGGGLLETCAKKRTASQRASQKRGAPKPRYILSRSRSTRSQHITSS